MTYADGRNPDLRVSDAERDVVAAELGRHYQDGRLDPAEFDQRMSAALAARTRRELDELTVDLPRPAGQQLIPAGLRSHRPPRILPILPRLIAAVVIAGALTAGAHGSWHHGGPFAPFGFLWLIIPAVVIGARIRGARRQWR
jgi:hypothetical protein